MSNSRREEDFKREYQTLQDLEADLQQKMLKVKKRKAKMLRSKVQGVFAKKGIPVHTRGSPPKATISNARRRIFRDSKAHVPYSDDEISYSPLKTSAADLSLSDDDSFDTFKGKFVIAPHQVSTPIRKATGVASPYLEARAVRRSSSGSDNGASGIQSTGWHISQLSSSPFQRSSSRSPGRVSGTSPQGIPSIYLQSNQARRSRSSSGSDMGAVSGIQSPEWYLDEADAIPPKGIPSAYLEPQRKSGSSSDEIYGACQSPDWDISHLASSPLRRSSGSGGKSRLVAVGGIQSPRKSPQISQKEINERIVGEIAYQLDQRILSYIFPEEVSLTDLTVKNATTDMLEIAKDPMTGEIDSKMLSQMGQNYVDILDRLRINQGYDDKIHPVFTECIFKSYGVLLRRPQPGTQEYLAYNDYNYLHDVIVSTVPEDIAPGCICLLNCLYHFSKTDEKPMFCW